MAPTALTNIEPTPVVQSTATQETTAQSLRDPTIPQLFSLVGRTSIVTGGARGLGITLAAALLEAGSHVYCLDILPDPSPKEWASLIVKARECDLIVKYRQVDITKQDVVNQVFEEIAAEAPEPIRVCVGAAGIQQEIPAMDYKAADWERMMSVNVVGAFNTSQAAALQMQKHGKGGSIILIASMSGSVANRGLFCAAYNSSKAAVLQMSRSFAVEWSGPDMNIRVNTVSPGYIRTAMTAMLLQAKPELATRWSGDNPMERISEPWEYKGPTVFLASDASSFCNGMDLRVDGGHCAW